MSFEKMNKCMKLDDFRSNIAFIRFLASSLYESETAAVFIEKLKGNISALARTFPIKIFRLTMIAKVFKNDTKL